MRVRAMRTWISVTATRKDRFRLESIAGDRNKPRSTFGGGRFVLVTADGVNSRVHDRPSTRAACLADVTRAINAQLKLENDIQR